MWLSNPLNVAPAENKAYEGSTGMKKLKCLIKAGKQRHLGGRKQNKPSLSF